MSKKEKKILRSFMMITQISITMLVPIFISGWLGTWLNRLFGTQIIFPFMLLLGIGAAFKNVYILKQYMPPSFIVRLSITIAVMSYIAALVFKFFLS